METTYIIKLTTTTTNRSFFLHTMQAKRLTKTRHESVARSFKTEADAQEFIKQHQAFFGYKWEAIARTK